MKLVAPPQLLLVPLLLTACGTAPAEPAGRADPTAPLRAAALAFLDSLDEAQREQATFSFDDPERKAWSNVPHTMFERRGVRLGEMTDAQKIRAHQLIRSPLSARGYLKVSGIMHVDEILQSFAARRRPDREPAYGHDYYWLGVFGDPATSEPWGWQLDGHHLALNFTVVGDEVSVTPTFLGANPAEVPEGVYAGFRPLGTEEDLGLAMFAMLDEAQRTKAVIAEDAPSDIVTGPGRAHLLEDVEGLPASEMTAAQRGHLMRLIREWAENLDVPLADQQLARIETAGIDEIHFAWAGTTPGKPHYFRIHGPTVLIEFENMHAPGRNDGPVNHVHSVWRDLERDYGGDLLLRHHHEHHGDHGHDHPHEHR